MARTRKLKLNSKGVVALLKSGEMARNLEERAGRIADAMPGGQWDVSTLYTDRVGVTVIAADPEARRAGAEAPQAVVAALDAGR